MGVISLSTQHVLVILQWGTHFGVFTSSTQHVLATIVWRTHCGVLTQSTPHFLVTPLWGTHWGGLQFKHPTHALVILQWGTRFGVFIPSTQHVWVTFLWGTHFGAHSCSTHTRWSPPYGEPTFGVLAPSTQCRRWSSSNGAPFWGPDLQPPPLCYGAPGCGCSPCASGACCPERRRRDPGGAAGARRWGARGWVPSCCARSRARGRGWGPTWRPARGLGLGRGPAEGFRPAGGPGSTSSAWELRGSWGEEREGKGEEGKGEGKGESQRSWGAVGANSSLRWPAGEQDGHHKAKMATMRPRWPP